MEYNVKFWKNYCEKSEGECNKEFSKFLRDLVFSLRSENILDVGCSNGIDFTEFPETFQAFGLDLNDIAIEKAEKKFPFFRFKKGSITKLPYEDSSIDFVFTHSVLNYIFDEDMKDVMSELYRVSRKYIASFEFFGEDEKIIEINEGIQSWYRNMSRRWADFNVKIISNVDMHEDYDPNKIHFTLVKKLG